MGEAKRRKEKGLGPRDQRTYIVPDHRKGTAEVILNTGHAFAAGDVRSYGLIVRWADGLEEQYWHVDDVSDYDMILRNLDRLRERIVAAKATVQNRLREADHDQDE
jgi:hypothetical protein